MPPIASGARNCVPVGAPEAPLSGDAGMNIKPDDNYALATLETRLTEKRKELENAQQRLDEYRGSVDWLLEAVHDLESAIAKLS